MSQATTFYLIAYDIPSDKRRTKVHKLLSGYGKWTQYSVFEAFLTEKELVALRNKLDRLLEPKTDSVRLYRMCEHCLGEVVTIGSLPPKEAVVFLV